MCRLQREKTKSTDSFLSAKPANLFKCTYNSTNRKNLSNQIECEILKEKMKFIFVSAGNFRNSKFSTNITLNEIATSPLTNKTVSSLFDCIFKFNEKQNQSD